MTEIKELVKNKNSEDYQISRRSWLRWFGLGIIVLTTSTLAGCGDVLLKILIALGQLKKEPTSKKDLQAYFDKNFPKGAIPHKVMNLKLDLVTGYRKIGGKDYSGCIKINLRTALIVESPPPPPPPPDEQGITPPPPPPPPPQVTIFECEYETGIVELNSGGRLYQCATKPIGNACPVFDEKIVQSCADKWLQEKEKQLKTKYPTFKASGVLVNPDELVLVGKEK